MSLVLNNSLRVHLPRPPPICIASCYCYSCCGYRNVFLNQRGVGYYGWTPISRCAIYLVRASIYIFQVQVRCPLASIESTFHAFMSKYNCMPLTSWYKLYGLSRINWSSALPRPHRFTYMALARLSSAKSRGALEVRSPGVQTAEWAVGQCLMRYISIGLRAGQISNCSQLCSLR